MEVTDGSFQLEYNVNFYCDHTSTYKTEENKKAPTCTERGSYDIVEYCRKCGEVVSTETIYSEAKGHDWGDWVIVKQPTSTKEGEKQRTCKHDPSHVEKETIPAIGGEEDLRNPPPQVNGLRKTVQVTVK